MSAVLKLSTYFGERDRIEDHLLADRLADLYAHYRVNSSVLLRGIEGFGLTHHLRTDRLLTLSEDLPVVSIAIDVPERIDVVLGELLQIKRRGLVTLERAQIPDEHSDAGKSLAPGGDGVKLTVYIGRHEQIAGRPAFVEICDLLHRCGVAGASVLLGIDGTIGGQRTRAKFFSRNTRVAMMIIAVGAPGPILNALSELAELPNRPFVTLERVRICKRDGQLLARPHELQSVDRHGLALWQKLEVYTSAQARHDGSPLHHALVSRLRHSGGAGATSLRGIWGFHGDHAPHGDRFLQVRRNVPVLTILIDSPKRIAESFGVIDELTATSGLVTSEMVPAMAAMTGTQTRGALRLADHRT